MDFFAKFFKPANKKYPSKMLNAKFVLYLRIIIAGYILYIAEGLFNQVFQGDKGELASEMKIVFAVIAAIFTIAAIYFFFISVRDLYLGKYVGGKMDGGDIDGVIEVSPEEMAAEKKEVLEEKTVENSSEIKKKSLSEIAKMKSED